MTFRPLFRRERTFSLIEVTVALAILAVVLVGLAAAMMSAVTVNRLMSEQAKAVTFAEGALNYVVSNQDFRGTYADVDGLALPKDATPANVWQQPFTSQRNLEFADYTAFTGDLSIVPWEYDNTNSPPTAVNPAADWLAGDTFEVVVTVSWFPNGAAVAKTIVLRTHYFPQAP